MKYIKYIIIIITMIILKPTNVFAEYPISGKTYIIKSAIDNNRSIDLYQSNINNGTNIQLYTVNNGNNQYWIFNLQEDNYYTINSSINQTKVLDIYRGLHTNYTNVQLYDNNNGDNQRWKIKYLSNGYVNIISKNSNYCLDVNGGKNINGTNIQIYQCNNSTAQQFKLVEVIEGTKTIEDGTYMINSAINEKQVLDVTGAKSTNGTNIELYQTNNGLNQKWEIKYLDDGYYSMTSKLNKNKCLDVYGASFKPETNVQLYTCHNSDNQKWIIKETDDDYYYIITPNEHLYLDAYKGVANNGTNIQIYPGNNTKGQKFKFTKTDTKTVESGSYTIKTNLDQNKSLDIYSGIVEENKYVKLYTSSNNNNQKWYIEKLKNGYYTIKSLSNSNLYLYSNSSTSIVSTKDVQWEITYYDEDKYYIKQKDTEKYLSVENSKTDNGTNLILTETPNNASIFYIESTTLNDNDRTMPDGYYVIHSILNTNQVMDVHNANKANNSNVELYKQNNGNNQIWYFKYLNNGYYSITSAMNPNTSLNNSSNNLNLYKLNNTDAQQWKLTDDTKGNKIIISKENNTCIDLPYNQTTNGANLQMYSCNNQDNQKFILTKYTNPKTYTGIDVSQYQGTIDWSKVAATNIGFVILRVGYGDNWTSQDDKKFIENVTGLEKYNIPYGVYIYSYAKKTTGSASLNVNSESATSETAHVMRLLNSVSYKPNLKTSVYLDMEDSSTQSLGKNKLTEIATTFCSTIQSNGYNCGIYANKSWLTNYLDAKTLASKYNIWLAEWISGNTHIQGISSKPSYNLTNYKLWQFSSKGTINGITGNVDLDLGYDIFG